MGLFDYITCEMPLPETPTPPPGDDFQTKDTPDQYMTTYTITADGRLTWRPYHLEEVPQHERPYPDGDGLLGAMGSIRRVEKEPEAIPYHGDIHFCHYREPGEWWEYRARFTEGVCSGISLVEYTPPKARPDDYPTEVHGG